MQSNPNPKEMKVFSPPDSPVGDTMNNHIKSLPIEKKTLILRVGEGVHKIFKIERNN